MRAIYVLWRVSLQFCPCPISFITERDTFDGLHNTVITLWQQCLSNTHIHTTEIAELIVVLPLIYCTLGPKLFWSWIWKSMPQQSQEIISKVSTFCRLDFMKNSWNQRFMNFMCLKKGFLTSKRIWSHCDASSRRRLMLGSLCTTQILKLKPFAHRVLYLLFPYYGTKKVLVPLSRG